MRVEVLGCDRWYVPSPWSECSTAVGDGSKSRDLLCNPADSDTACPATVEQSEIQMCQPVNGSWSPWGLWSSCDVTCGEGLQMRNRSCDSPAPANGGLYCSGNDTDFQLCTRAPCPVNGNWSQWSSWSACDVTCGFGSQWRNRSCDNPPPQHGGENCTGSSVDLQSCGGLPCPVNGNWSQWSSWSTCDVTCGFGSQWRNRSCDNPPPQHGGTNCTGSSADIQSCAVPPCAVNGNWSQWSSWSACDVTCGFGSQWRNRSCDNPPPQHGGENCTGSSADLQICEGPPCAVNGNWSQWSSWSTCDVTCGFGSQARNRSCDNPPPQHGGDNCTGSSVEVQTCEETPCAVDGNWSVWSSWSTCDVSCGVGYKTRNRSCNNPAPLYGGADCNGTSNDIQLCDSLPLCKVDGGWSQWEAWSNCTVTCAGGTRTRSRTCDQPPPQNGGRRCNGDSTQSETCTGQVDPSCYVDGVWSPWSLWTTCMTVCGLGNQTRNRTCSQPLYGGANCTGEEDETRACTGPLEPHCTSTADPSASTVPVTTPSPDPLAPSDGGTMEEFSRWETGEALPEDYDAEASPVDMSKAGSPDTFSTLEAKVHFKRRLPYYVLRVFTPTATVVAVSWMSFWVHYSETSARVALGCTTFLMLVRLGSQIEKMPHISYIRAIDLWYVFCLAFAFMVIVEYAVVHHLHNPQNKKVKQKEKKERKTVPSPRKSQEDESVAVSPRTRFAQAVKQARARPPSAGRSRVSPDPGAHDHAKSSGKPVKVKPSGWELIIPPTSRHASSKPAGGQDSARRQGDGRSTLVQGADANTTYHVMQGQTTRKRRRYRGTQGEQGDLATTTSPTQKTLHKAKGPPQDNPSTSSGSAAPPESIPEEPPAAANEQKKAEKNPEVVYKKPCNIDVWSRVIFPVGFLLFSIIYWAYYLYN
ncbi:PREDICTED: SCO-spondin-like [Branchiostoma belcheri]|uniref:SCO-spondin-like n=1 Tax=Branchiostoma belcheri TaxID=7741 RepID=A0A6P4XKL7_BRABE|nr:PREDICTED: SCO-spondin-like [Branchiostoma belcheri]